MKLRNEMLQKNSILCEKNLKYNSLHRRVNNKFDMSSENIQKGLKNFTDNSAKNTLQLLQQKKLPDVHDNEDEALKNYRHF